MYGFGGGASSADHQLVGGHVLAQHERALLQVAGELALAGDEHERPAVADQAVGLEPVGDERRGVALPDVELDLRRVGRDRLGQRGAEVLADDVGDEREVEGGGVVLGHVEDRVVHERPQRRQGDDEHDARPAAR